MIITPIRTPKLLSGQESLLQFLGEYIGTLDNGSIVAVTSKIVSLCESSIVPVGSIDKEELIRQQSDYFLPSDKHKYGYHFSVVDSTLISSAGIDESNGNGN